MFHHNKKNRHNDHDLLQTACQSGDVEKVKALLTSGLNPNILFEEVYSPLYLAASEGHSDIVKLLLQHGADIKLGNSPIDMAKQKCHWKVVSMLYNNRACTPYKDEHYVKTEPYARLIMINFLQPRVVNSLKQRWKDKYPNNPCIIINGYDVLSKKIQLDNISGVTHIYVIAHGNAKRNFFLNHKGEKIDTDALVDGMVHYIGDQNVVIELLSCAAARGQLDEKEDKSYDSIAAQFHLLLVFKAERDIPVVARMQVICIDKKYAWYEFKGLLSTPGAKSTFNLEWTAIKSKEMIKEDLVNRDDLLRKQPGSKVVFVLDENGQQVRRDAYLFWWRKHVFKTFLAIASYAQGAKRQLLDGWRSDFNNQSPEQILQMLNTEISKANSILKQSDYYFGWFKGENSYKKIEDLVKEGERLLGSKYTKVNPVLTGLDVSCVRR